MIERIGLALKRDGYAPADLHLTSDGNLATVKNAEAVGQHVRQRLMTYHGEWFLDNQVGVTWLSDVLGQSYDPLIAEALTKGEILETDGVTGIETFSTRFSRDTRGLTAYNITVNTVYDEQVTLNG